MENIYDYLMRVHCGKKKKPKLKVHPQDDRMMENGTINPNHWTLKGGCQTNKEFNTRQQASKYN